MLYVEIFNIETVTSGGEDRFNRPFSLVLALLAVQL
jgi:hypothetical protein